MPVPSTSERRLGAVRGWILPTARTLLLVAFATIGWLALGHLANTAANASTAIDTPRERPGVHNGHKAHRARVAAAVSAATSQLTRHSSRSVERVESDVRQAEARTDRSFTRHHLALRHLDSGRTAVTPAKTAAPPKASVERTTANDVRALGSPLVTGTKALVPGLAKATARATRALDETLAHSLHTKTFTTIDPAGAPRESAPASELDEHRLDAAHPVKQGLRASTKHPAGADRADRSGTRIVPTHPHPSAVLTGQGTPIAGAHNGSGQAGAAVPPAVSIARVAGPTAVVRPEQLAPPAIDFGETPVSPD